VISLKDSWQAQRQQRQAAAAQRQQQVYKTLEQFHKARQLKASELREDLRLFQLELQLDTQEFLSQVQQQRYAQAEQLVQRLHSFAQTLREQTAQLLAEKAIDRAAMAQQVAQDLSEFHADLSLSVAVLRQGLKLELQTIQLTVQQLLKDHQQERIQNRIEQVQALESWIEILQLEVKNYLSELALLRYDRAHQLQTMLKHDRDQRCLEMEALFQQFGQFRAELKTYRAALHHTVWGEMPAGDKNETEMSTDSLHQSSVKEKHIVNSAQPQRVQLPATTLQNAKNNNPTKQSAKRLTPRTAKSSTSIQNAKSKESSPTVPLNVPPSPGVQVPLPMPPSSVLEEQIEKQVYTYIRQTQGARLTEIETTLNINRFQAVDALRILIKKGLVTQRDRTYLIQEEVSL